MPQCPIAGDANAFQHLSIPSAHMQSVLKVHLILHKKMFAINVHNERASVHGDLVL